MPDPMKIWEVQDYVRDLIDAHPRFAEKNVKCVLDDGTYPKIPGLEKTLRETGLALIVWRIGSFGLIDVSKAGASNQLLHIAVVIQENETVNRLPDDPAPPAGITPTRIMAEQALQYVLESVSGKPKNTPPGTPILPHNETFANLGNVNGTQTIIVNFSKEHRVTPLTPP